jgi:PAS domain S-box-containing protein
MGRHPTTISEEVDISAALSVAWAGEDARDVGRALAEELVSLLRPDLIYLLLQGVDGAPLVEVAWSGSTNATLDERAVDVELRQQLGQDRGDWPRVVRRPLFGGDMSIVTVRLGGPGDMGVVVAASGRPGFPDESEGMRLNVVAKQAVLALRVAQLTRERRRLEEALRRREIDFQLIVDSIPVPVAVTTPTGEVEGLNRATLEYFGKTLDELKSWKASEVVHPEDLEQTVAEQTAAHMRGDTYNVQSRHLRADGVYRWFNVLGLPLRDQQGQIIRWFHLQIDIDDRKRAEDAARASEADLRQASYHLNEAQRLSQTGSFTSDLESDKHTWSDELYRIYEFDRRSEVTLQRLRDVVHPEDAALFNASIDRALAGAPDEFEFRIVTPGGVKHLRAVAHRIADRPVFVGAVQDVTDKKAAEQARDKARSELTHAARAMSLGVLAASIAHEVNQPLAGIITNGSTGLRMLAAEPPNVEGATEMLRRIARDGNRASEVISRLRALFGKKELAAEPVDLNEAAREVMTLSSQQMQRHKIALRARLDQDLPRVSGDRVQLQQVILNLLLNASDAVKSITDRPREICVETTRDHGSALLSVRDTGVGIELEDFNKLFAPFYTTKPEGMGIGLSVSRDIIERHGGRLSASRNDGPGATFSFLIPGSPALENDSRVRPAPCHRSPVDREGSVVHLRAPSRTTCSPASPRDRTASEEDPAHDRDPDE